MVRLALVLLLLSPGGAIASSAELATLGLRIANTEEAKALTVTAVQSGSTAYFAGFQPGDLIVSIDQARSLDAEWVSTWLKEFKVGEQLGVTWRFLAEGELSAEPIRTALMVGISGSEPWMDHVELGPEAGKLYTGKHPYRDIRWYERFEWPNRRPVAGLVEAVKEAAAHFPIALKHAESKVADLSCKSGVSQVVVDQTIAELAQALTVSRYRANGFINTYYDSHLRDESSKACAAACAANPKDPWGLAVKAGTKEPNACQLLLAFDRFLTALWRVTMEVPSDCSTVSERGCAFFGNGSNFEVRLTKFAKIGCRGANHECDYSIGFTCKATLRGVYKPALCDSIGAPSSRTQTASFVADGDGHWKLVPEPKGRPLEGTLQDVDALCPQVVEAMRCPQRSL